MAASMLLRRAPDNWLRGGRTAAVAAKKKMTKTEGVEERENGVAAAGGTVTAAATVAAAAVAAAAAAATAATTVSAAGEGGAPPLPAAAAAARVPLFSLFTTRAFQCLFWFKLIGAFGYANPFIHIKAFAVDKGFSASDSTIPLAILGTQRERKHL